MEVVEDQSLWYLVDDTGGYVIAVATWTVHLLSAYSTYYGA